MTVWEVRSAWPVRAWSLFITVGTLVFEHFDLINPIEQLLWNLFVLLFEVCLRTVLDVLDRHLHLVRKISDLETTARLLTFVLPEKGDHSSVHVDIHAHSLLTFSFKRAIVFLWVIVSIPVSQELGLHHVWIDIEVSHSVHRIIIVLGRDKSDGHTTD